MHTPPQSLRRLVALFLLLASLLHQVADALEMAGVIHLPDAHTQTATDNWPDPLLLQDCSSDEGDCDHCHGHTHIFIGLADDTLVSPAASQPPVSHERFALSASLQPDQRPPIL